RHTRCSRDWSSDVCSSDLFGGAGQAPEAIVRRRDEAVDLDQIEPTLLVVTPALRLARRQVGFREPVAQGAAADLLARLQHKVARSEERRVGQQWRSRSTPG